MGNETSNLYLSKFTLITSCIFKENSRYPKFVKDWLGDIFYFPELYFINPITLNRLSMLLQSGKFITITYKIASDGVFCVHQVDTIPISWARQGG